MRRTNNWLNAKAFSKRSQPSRAAGTMFTFKSLGKKLSEKSLGKNEEGFLGPIGDDLPSLIPLLFGLVIFFSSFAFAFQTFEEKSNSFQNDLDALRVAATLKSDGYVTNWQEFQDLCETITVKRLNYVAGLIDIQPTEGENIFDLEFEESNENNESFGRKFSCSNQELSEFSFEALTGKRLISRTFPIILQKNKISYPKRLVVVLWN